MLKAAQESEQRAHDGSAINGDLAADTLLRDLLTLSTAQQTGEMQMALPGGEAATIFLAAGRIAEARMAGTWGPAAVRQILAAHDGTYRFIASDEPVYPQRIDDAAPWLLVETIEHLNEARRGRQAR